MSSGEGPAVKIAKRNDERDGDVEMVDAVPIIRMTTPNFKTSATTKEENKGFTFSKFLYYVIEGTKSLARTIKLKEERLLMTTNAETMVDLFLMLSKDQAVISKESLGVRLAEGEKTKDLRGVKRKVGDRTKAALSADFTPEEIAWIGMVQQKQGTWIMNDFSYKTLEAWTTVNEFWRKTDYHLSKDEYLAYAVKNLKKVKDSVPTYPKENARKSCINATKRFELNLGIYMIASQIKSETMYMMQKSLNGILGDPKMHPLCPGSALPTEIMAAAPQHIPFGTLVVGAIKAKMEFAKLPAGSPRSIKVGAKYNQLVSELVSRRMVPVQSLRNKIPTAERARAGIEIKKMLDNSNLCCEKILDHAHNLMGKETFYYVVPLAVAFQLTDEDWVFYNPTDQSATVLWNKYAKTTLCAVGQGKGEHAGKTSPIRAYAELNFMAKGILYDSLEACRKITGWDILTRKEMTHLAANSSVEKGNGDRVMEFQPLPVLAHTFGPPQKVITGKISPTMQLFASARIAVQVINRVNKSLIDAIKSGSGEKEGQYEARIFGADGITPIVGLKFDFFDQGGYYGPKGGTPYKALINNAKELKRNNLLLAMMNSDQLVPTL